MSVAHRVVNFSCTDRHENDCRRSNMWGIAIVLSMSGIAYAWKHKKGGLLIVGVITFAASTTGLICEVAASYGIQLLPGWGQ